MMRILVCGGRDYGELTGLKPHSTLWNKKYAEARHVIDSISAYVSQFATVDPTDMEQLPDVIIISGMAKGVDSLAVDWAIVHWCNVEEYPANWKKYGKAAGFIRNKQMLVEGKPDVVLAFPGGRGTASMVALAKEAGVKVIEFQPVDI